MQEVLVNRLGGLSLPRKSVARLTDHSDMTLDVYPGRKTTTIYLLSATCCVKCVCGVGWGGGATEGRILIFSSFFGGGGGGGGGGGYFL